LAIHATINAEEMADRLAIRELVDGYAYCADRRDAAAQMALFTPDTHFVVYMDAKSATLTQELHGRGALAPVFENLTNYKVTTHFNGQSTVELEGSRATGVSYCLAHHVSAQEGKESLMIASIRYLDTFAKQEGQWYFAERRLMVDWIETRPLVSPIGS
jgi:ketosteroid isomerase-like protein